MHKFAAWALAALLAGTAAWAQVPPTTGEDEVALIKQGGKALDDKNPAESARLLKIAVDAPAFQLINEEGQRITQRILAAAAYDINDYPTAARAARAATIYPKADGDDWAMRVWASAAVNDTMDVVTSTTTLAAKWPDRMKAFRLRMITWATQDVKNRPGGEELDARLMQALLAAKWKPADALAMDADSLWLGLVRFDLKWNNTAEAKAVAGAIENPTVLREMQTDKTFDAIVASDPAHFDSDKAAEKEIGARLKWIDKNPDLLDPVIYAALAYHVLDRQNDALALLDRAKDRVDRKGKETYKDHEDQLNWLYDTRSRVLMALGRTDEAIAELEAGAKLNEGGKKDISQIINLAFVYDSVGRPKDALSGLKGMDIKGASNYGRMEYESARVCAYSQLQDTKGIADAMAFIDLYEGDDVGAKLHALLCAGNLDGAARFVIDQLGKPERRSAIISQLQDMALPKQLAVTPFQQQIRDREQALRARDDVRKALEPYGRIMKFKVVSYS